ncbi:MAG: TonB-dependent receptor [Crocinitomicaceae bacterium]|nr:TonB-dependent receptor [Crocinitomicaceae bacterium]
MSVYLKLTILFFPIVFSTTIVAQETKDTTQHLLDLSLLELSQIKVVSASEAEKEFVKAPSIITVITKHEIESRAVTSLIDILKFVPGIETSMGNDGNYRVSIRGERKSGNVLVLIDGHPINDFYSGLSIYDFPTEFIEQIEVIRGPGSANHGTNAVAGVINILTKDNERSALLMGGTTNRFGGNFNYNHTNDKDFSIVFSGGYVQTDGANTDPRSREPQSQEQADETNRWLKDGYLNLKMGNEKLKFSLFGIARNHGAWVGGLYTLTTKSNIKRGQILSDLSYEIKLSERLSLTPKIYGDFIRVDNLLQERPKGYISQSSGSVFTEGKFSKENYHAINPKGELILEYRVTEKFKNTMGLIYEHLSFRDYNVSRNFNVAEDIYIGSFGNHDNVDIDQKDAIRNIFAYFYEADYEIENLSFTAGLRYDRYSDFGEFFSPRFGIIWEIKKNLNVKLLHGRAFRTPTFKELYDKTNISTLGVQGNTQLQPEKVNSTEFEIQYTQTRYLIRVNAYRNLNEDIISIFDPQGFGAPGTYENIGTIRTLGYEVEGAVDLTKKLRLFANFSHFHRSFEWDTTGIVDASFHDYLNDSINGSKCLLNAPVVRFNAGLILNVYKFDIFAGFNYGSGSAANDRMPLEGIRNVDIPDYWQLSFSVAYVLNKKLTFRISGNNLGPIKYSDPDDSTSIHKLGKKGMAQPNETILFTMKYYF